MTATAYCGFGLWKPTHASVGSPDDVAGWLGLGSTSLPPPNSVAVAAGDLDEIALRTASPMLPVHHFRLKKISAKHRHMLGLDQPSPTLRLRVAVAGAHRFAWHYAELYQQFLDDRGQVRSANEKLAKAIEALEQPAHQVANVLSRHSGGTMDDRPAVQHYLRSLRELLGRSESWEDGTETWVQQAHRPDRLFYLRLAEIYVQQFGKRVPLHHTAERAGTGSPDDQFSQFLTTVLRCVRWPTPETSRDDALRGLNLKKGDHAWVRAALDRLLERVQDQLAPLDLGDMPSYGWAIDFDPANTRGLV